MGRCQGYLDLTHKVSCDFLMVKIQDHGLRPSSSEKIFLKLQISQKPLFSLACENIPTIVFMGKMACKWVVTFPFFSLEL